MTNRNNTEINKQAQKKSVWPAWFPYPSSWLKAIVLALFLRVIAFVFTHTGEFGFKIANFTNSPDLLIIFAILAIISPIFVITFTHHIVHVIISQFFPSIQTPEIRKTKGFIPGIVSIWEGLYGWLVVYLSTLISSLLLIIFLPIPNINFYQPLEFYIEHQETLQVIIGTTWIINAALLYQIDFLFKQRLLSVSFPSYKPEPNIQIPIQIPSSLNPTTTTKDDKNTVYVEMDNLRGSMGLTQMKSRKNSPTNSQSSHKNTQQDNFEEAVKLAKNAAQITRTAKTKSEWYQVGKEWQKTIEMLKNVPPSHPKYAAAQEKIIDYQKYINYAQKIINSKHINN
ncbi:MAG: hypothetical protein EAZ76_14450 [Nostocales cyanobacterium]|nr:MAG: hypothetical protein EAZ87_17750 [Nostocales cyanobacterium]TAF12365.1 MAG: hypothetical protein EAZ76_14450 [Nostocales cyanobacterium]